MSSPRYKVGTRFVWDVDSIGSNLVGTVTAIDLERKMYVYTIYDPLTKKTNNHDGYDIKVIEEITRPLTKLERALR